MAQTIKRKGLLPVLGAIAEALLPGEPDKAAAARRLGQQDVAILHEMSGKQQTNHLHQVWLPHRCHVTALPFRKYGTNRAKVRCRSCGEWKNT